MHNDDFVDINSQSQVNKVYKSNDATGIILPIVAFVFSIFFAIAGFVMVFAPSFIYSIIDKITYDPVQRINYDDSFATNDQVVKTDSLLEDENVLNILLFGQDSVAEGGGDKYGRSDTVILMSIDNNNKKLKLTSFQRDTYVAIPGYGSGKLNSAFTLGGVPLSIATIEANFGVKVDKYACVDFDSFRKIIGILGGVDIELTTDEIRYINAQIDVNNQLSKTSFLEYNEYLGDDETQMMHLDGYQALWYARNRGAEWLGDNPAYTFSGDDWDRTQRQRKLLETIMKSMKGASIDEILQIVNSIGPYITTDLTENDITFLIMNSLDYLSYEMVEISMPTTGNWVYGTTNDGQSVISVTNWNNIRAELSRFIYEGKVQVN